MNQAYVRGLTVPSFALGALLLAATLTHAQSGNQPPPLLSDLVDVSPDFHDYTNAYYLADHLGEFDSATGSGRLTWLRHQLYPRIAFNNMEAVLRPFEGVVFPEGEYPTNPALPFAVPVSGDPLAGKARLTVRTE